MDITETHVNNVIEISNKVKAIKFHQHKKDAFNSAINQQDVLTKYLFSFCVYHSLFNPRWRVIEASRYYSITLQEVNQATFWDFLKVLKHYENFRVTSRREKFLIKFLQKCDKVHFEFYCSLFDKTFIKDLPLTNVQENLDLDAVDISEAYTIEQLKEQLDELTYPITITTIDTRDAEFIIHSVEASRTSQRIIKDGQLELVKNRILRNEKVYNKFPEYTLCGYIYELEKEEKNSGSRGKKKGHKAASHRFVPIDYFSNLSNFSHYFLGSGVGIDYQRRIDILNDYLATTCTSTVRDSFVGFAEKPEDVQAEILRLMTGKEHSFLLFSDSNSARLGRAKAIECQATEGIIEDYWVEDGLNRGFKTWFNGHIRDVAFNFSGDANRLLNSLKPIKRKLLKFLHIEIEGVKYYYGVSVDLDKKPWMYRPTWQGLLFEKCVLCGGTDYIHSYKGLCRSCDQNLAYHLKTYGTDNWIPAYLFKERKRRASCWSYEVLNVAKARYKGHLLVAREDGFWMMKTDEESMTKYLEYKEKLDAQSNEQGRKTRKDKRTRKRSTK